MRSLADFAFPLLAPPLYNALGYGWVNTLLALVCGALGVVPVLLRNSGAQWRATALIKDLAETL